MGFMFIRTWLFFFTLDLYNLLTCVSEKRKHATANCFTRARVSFSSSEGHHRAMVWRFDKKKRIARSALPATTSIQQSTNAKMYVNQMTWRDDVKRWELITSRVFRNTVPHFFERSFSHFPSEDQESISWCPKSEPISVKNWNWPMHPSWFQRRLNLGYKDCIFMNCDQWRQMVNSSVPNCTCRLHSVLVLRPKGAFWKPVANWGRTKCFCINSQWGRQTARQSLFERCRSVLSCTFGRFRFARSLQYELPW